jgi:hypothetical protein
VITATAQQSAPPPKPPDPVVWLYGFIPMTRRRYTFQLIVTLGLAIGIFFLWGIYWPTYRDYLTRPHDGPLPAKGKAEDNPAVARMLFIGDIFRYVVAGVGVLQLVEAYFVFGMLTRKEQEAAEAATTAPPEAKA